MTEALYTLETVGGDILWEGLGPSPSRPDIKHPTLEAFRPLYFSAEDLLERVGLSLPMIRSRAIELAVQRPYTEIVKHPTVLENIENANKEVLLWYLPGRDLGLSGLDELYAGSLFEMAQRRVPLENVLMLEPDQSRYCVFVTQIRPAGSRMDIHVDGRKSVIINLSESEFKGSTLLGHPDLRQYAGSLTVGQLMDDSRTVVQRIRPGCGVAFDTTTVPHAGISEPGTDGYRIVLDADYQIVGHNIDLSSHDSYN